ncbi:hypothetical protein GQ44DRAFT_731803 [Phaeosphaeriaceae sp. PMI808]|nr:hypothetical protein GQ44DRAFT_731803 [Phaeosphaeriaceae sp. PMI808]
MLVKEHLDTLMSVYCLAYTLHQQDQYEEALSLYHRAWIGYQENLGVVYPTTQRCLYYSSLQHLYRLERPESDTNPLSSTKEDIVHASSGQQLQPIVPKHVKTSKRRKLLRKLGLE